MNPKKQSNADNPVNDLQTEIDAAIAKVTALGVLVSKIDRTARQPVATATLGRLSVACGEFVDRLQSTGLDPLAEWGHLNR